MKVFNQKRQDEEKRKKALARKRIKQMMERLEK